jgi:hypothetical protein
MFFKIIHKRKRKKENRNYNIEQHLKQQKSAGVGGKSSYIRYPLH